MYKLAWAQIHAFVNAWTKIIIINSLIQTRACLSINSALTNALMKTITIIIWPSRDHLRSRIVRGTTTRPQELSVHHHVWEAWWWWRSHQLWCWWVYYIIMMMMLMSLLYHHDDAVMILNHSMLTWHNVRLQSFIQQLFLYCSKVKVWYISMSWCHTVRWASFLESTVLEILLRHTHFFFITSI